MFGTKTTSTSKTNEKLYLARNLARCINNERRRLRKRAVRL